jgi:hypothetical protein
LFTVWSILAISRTKTEPLPVYWQHKLK